MTPPPLSHLNILHSWWDRLTTKGPSYGYFVNPSKTWLVTKDLHLQNAVKTFAGSGVNITPNGRPYLGAALGSPDFIEEHLRSKVGDWTSSIPSSVRLQSLSPMLPTQPWYMAFQADGLT